ncbi:putative ribosomal protein YlxQ [compost metagenome]
MIVAKDASANTHKKFRDKCGTYKVPLIIGFDREVLGSSVGKPERVVLALTDQGFADMIRKEIVKTSEVEYIE